jgi:catechol 2,3-dioxygenase-like lactoylglutathione lyase family enzyme
MIGRSSSFPTFMADSMNVPPAGRSSLTSRVAALAATGINHVTVLTLDLDESERFYAELLGAERVVSPNFGTPVRWLRIGDAQIHLFQSDTGGGGVGHFGVTVDDLAPVYERAKALDALDPVVNGHYLWQLPDGVVQLYVRDPSGNLVEVNAREANGVPARALASVQPQSDENLRARLLT